MRCLFFFFNDTATTEIYTLSLHERSSDLDGPVTPPRRRGPGGVSRGPRERLPGTAADAQLSPIVSAPNASRSSCTACCSLRSEEHTSELQSRQYLVCRLLLEKKKKHNSIY